MFYTYVNKISVIFRLKRSEGEANFVTSVDVDVPTAVGHVTVRRWEIWSGNYSC